MVSIGSQGSRFVVIGSNCFTGSHIVSALLQNHKNWVFGVSRSPEKCELFLPYKQKENARFRFLQIDIDVEHERLIGFLDEIQPDYIINAAALSEVYQSHVTPVEYFDVNTLAVVRLANELKTRAWLKRYIHISSAEVYGNCEGPALETAPLKPSTPYAVSKMAADHYLLTAAQHSGFPVTLIRSTNVYGKCQQLFKIIPRTIIHLKTNQVIELHEGGRAIRPFIHIRDVVEGILRVVEAESPACIYNFSTEDERPISEIVRLICDRMGRDFSTATRVVDCRPQQDYRYWLNTERARNELGWEPSTTLEQGIEEMVQWIAHHWNEISKEPLKYIHRVHRPIYRKIFSSRDGLFLN